MSSTKAKDSGKFIKIAIFVQHCKAACYRCDTIGRWTNQRIRGEHSVELKQGKPKALDPIISEVSGQLNREQALEDVEIHLIYGRGEADFMVDAPKALGELGCRSWQILRLEPLLERAATASGISPDLPLEGDDNWLKKFLLPILASTFSYTNKAFEAEEARAKQAHEETMDTLRADVMIKQQEVAELQARINALELPGMEHLLVYLPAIYHNFWGAVQPADLALLAGTLSVPDIPSPHPDPSPDTVAVLKRRFMKLANMDRERVLAFCRDMPHRLEIRTEMRDLLEEN